MAGITNHAFRVICKRYGAGLVVTELLSSHAIHYKNAKTFGMFDWSDSERPVSVQLFGGDPDLMAEAARVVEERGADMVDLNMGCWVPKVARTGAGAALMKDAPLAEKVLAAMVGAVKIPVTVKIRAGWDSKNLTAIDFAKRAENAGAKAIAVHARFASQGFTGTADWSIIARVKQAVQIPVIGNGDVESGEDAARMLAETGCDGVMIGRAAVGNPWIFKEALVYLSTGEACAHASLSERCAVAVEHLKAYAADPNVGERRAVREMRGQLPQYFKGFPGAVRLRNELVQHQTVREIENLLKKTAGGSL